MVVLVVVPRHKMGMQERRKAKETDAEEHSGIVNRRAISN